MRRPAVGITASTGALREQFCLRDDYVRAVEAAGGLPLALVPGRPADAPLLLDRVDALVLSGGADVDPALYGEARHPTVEEVFPERDAFEIALVHEAIARDLPLLAICRGLQVLNVALDGTLVQDVPSEVKGAMDHHPEGERWALTHSVRIVHGTRLHGILGQDRLEVNSIHHQAVRAAASGCVVNATCVEDGVVEGLELPDRQFVVGVQWHPEAFWDHGGRFQALFEALVRAARRP